MGPLMDMCRRGAVCVAPDASVMPELRRNNRADWAWGRGSVLVLGGSGGGDRSRGGKIGASGACRACSAWAWNQGRHAVKLTAQKACMSLDTPRGDLLTLYLTCGGEPCRGVNGHRRQRRPRGPVADRALSWTPRGQGRRVSRRGHLVRSGEWRDGRRVHEGGRRGRGPSRSHQPGETRQSLLKSGRYQAHGGLGVRVGQQPRRHVAYT